MVAVGDPTVVHARSTHNHRLACGRPACRWTFGSTTTGLSLVDIDGGLAPRRDDIWDVSPRQYKRWRLHGRALAGPVRTALLPIRVRCLLCRALNIVNAEHLAR